MKRIMHVKRATVCFALLLCLLFGSVTALAVETAEVRIPVSASGADCTAVLLDVNGSTVQMLALKSGETAYFTVTCTGLRTNTFTIRLSDTDTDTVTYDKTAFQVNVELYYDSKGEIAYTLDADPTGVLGDNGKPDKLEFTNTVKLTPPAPVDPSKPMPTPAASADPSKSTPTTRTGTSPRTGDDSAPALWYAVFAVSFIGLLMVVILSTMYRRKEKKQTR